MAIHPRTTNLMKVFGIDRNKYQNISFIDPQSYLENLSFLNQSAGLITDSGGMQKEAYWMEKKCVTIRKETEWSETLMNNCNTLLFDDLSGLQNIFDDLTTNWNSNLYGDGNCSQKIVNQILKDLK